MEVNVIKRLTTQPYRGIMRWDLSYSSFLISCPSHHHNRGIACSLAIYCLRTALIDIDSKCSKIRTSKEIFDSFQRSNVCIWNWMINGLAVHELARDTISLHEDVVLDSITFL
ncbi:hypothetical protein POTOM_049682 [Populus tomentosa]|uniref:Uncharacterized protein n=1 Tax=Populus tomentosa TaxID=118781 RepID=A0A8X7YAP8_POPTO|nr:hypothetical protein POTOM_049682 [Populus tomentosa]